MRKASLGSKELGYCETVSSEGRTFILLSNTDRETIMYLCVPNVSRQGEAKLETSMFQRY